MVGFRAAIRPISMSVSATGSRIAKGAPASYPKPRRSLSRRYPTTGESSGCTGTASEPGRQSGSPRVAANPARLNASHVGDVADAGPGVEPGAQRPEPAVVGGQFTRKISTNSKSTRAEQARDQFALMPPPSAPAEALSADIRNSSSAGTPNDTENPSSVDR